MCSNIGVIHVLPIRVINESVIQCNTPWNTTDDNDNGNDKVFLSTLIIHFIFNTAIDAFAY